MKAGRGTGYCIDIRQFYSRRDGFFRWKNTGRGSLSLSARKLGSSSFIDRHTHDMYKKYNDLCLHQFVRVQLIILSRVCLAKVFALLTAFCRTSKSARAQS